MNESSMYAIDLDRFIRVFVSSTFRDMQAERDELVLVIFPQLRRLCEDRGVTWTEIDLRWGITEEQSQRGEVLAICLEQIRRCRPYFIGLLGERYGWVPDSIPKEVLERELWITHYTVGDDRKSVTELEILHGVLNDPAMADNAFFYFRDRKFINSIPEENRSDFLPENAVSETKLKDLKAKIRQQYREGHLKYAPREDFADAKSLGQLILADFTNLIDRLFPTGSEPSPLEKERADHEAFARSRAGVYIGRDDYFQRLDAHIASEDGPLVVLGESGGGKSALLSNWALTYRQRHPDDFLLMHFIGSSPHSSDPVAMLRRIMLELKECFELPDELPGQPEQIRDAFPEWLTKVAGLGRIVLILDALNQLQEADAARDLGWLPRVFPPNVKVIVSTLSGRTKEALEARCWLKRTKPLRVQPLDDPERRTLIYDYLGQFSRDLGSARTNRLVEAPQTANPLYLRVLLNELRIFGIHEQLNERIEWYLEADDPRLLFRKVIQRWEQVYAAGTDRVRESLSLLWAARHGLSEAELLELLGSDGKPLPQAEWSPLFLAMSDSLVTRGGLLNFAHDYLRSAVEKECLRETPSQQTAHRRLANYFQDQPNWTERKVNELPWQLTAAAEWYRLHDVLTEEPCFTALQQRAPYELLGYWLQLKPHGFELGTSYTEAFARWEAQQIENANLSPLASRLGRFLYDIAACHTAAEPLMRRALAIDEQSYGAVHPSVADKLNNLSLLVADTNRLAEAEPLMHRALAIFEKSYGENHSRVAAALANLAELLRTRNRLAEAEPLMRRALAIDEQSYGTEHPYVAIRLNNLGMLLGDTNRFAEAEPLLRRALGIDEQAYAVEHPSIAIRLSNLASLLQATNRLAEAEPLYRRALAIDEQAYGAEHPLVAVRLNNLAQLLDDTNRQAEAEPQMRRALTIFEKSYGENHPNVATALLNLAALLHAMNRLEKAETLMRRALAIDEQSYGTEHPKVAICLNNLVSLLRETNRLEEAELLARRALAIDEKSYGAKHPNVARDLNNVAQLLQATNRLAEAEPLVRRALAINEQSYGAEHPNVAICLNNLAQLQQATNRLAEAEPLMRRALAIDEQSYGAYHPSVAGRLNNLASLLKDTNRLSEAELLIRRALAIDEQSYGAEHPSVATDLNNLAELLSSTKRLAEAEPLYRRALAIDEQSYGAEHLKVAGVLNNLALLLMAGNRLAEAEPLMRRAQAIFQSSFGPDHPNTQIVQQNYDCLLREVVANAVHPYLQLQLLTRLQQAAIQSEDYELAGKCRDESAVLNCDSEPRHFDPDSLKLLDRVQELGCIAIPVKQAIGGRLISAERQVSGENVEAVLQDIELGIATVEDHFAEFSDHQFRKLCDRLHPIRDKVELFSELDITSEAQKQKFSVSPEAWLAYLLKDGLDSSGIVFCIANRWAQMSPTKEEAFQVADLFDRLGYPGEASALRTSFSDGDFESDVQDG